MTAYIPFFIAAPVTRSIPTVKSGGTALTAYDHEHAITYMRLLDADTEGTDWREVARIVLRIDPDREPDRARLAFDSHLTRAKWMSRYKYRHLLRSGWPRADA